MECLGQRYLLQEVRHERIDTIRLGRAVRFLRAEVEALERKRETRIAKNLEVLQAADPVSDDMLAA